MVRRQVTTKGEETGKIEYTGRALLQDAQEAMGGDIVRGLVELITNSDDAYARKGAGPGKIVVEVEHRRGKPWIVVVRDRATGMSRDELSDRIRRLGARSSGFERGLNVRGNRGRGAKDLVAFGEVEFASIKDGRISAIVLRQDGTYTLSGSRDATEEARSTMGIPRGNGTVVTVSCLPTVRCPQHPNLMEQLRCHFQLRDIMSDRNREVVLVNLNKPEQRERLRYALDQQALEEVVNSELPLEGYPEAAVSLRLWRLPERCEKPRSDPYRPSGILITGRRAIYDNTLASFESNRHAGWYTGRLDCPYIDQLAKEFDDTAECDSPHPVSNPTPLISRRREGLAPDHPFARSLFQALDCVLREVVAAEEQREREGQRIENESTRERLDRMAREAARFLQEALREIELEDPPPGGLGDVEPLQIVPPEAIARLGEERVLSVLARAQGLGEGEEVALAMEPEGVVDLIAGQRLQLKPHGKRQDVLAAQIQMRPLVEGAVLISATVADREAVGLVSVIPAIEDEQDEDEEIPESLEFERPRYRVRWNKQKRIILRAPAELIEKHGKGVDVISDSTGIVIRGGGRVQLRVASQAGVAEGSCRIEGRELGANGKLTARLGNAEASCRVSVEQRDEGLPNLRIELTQKNPSIYRALFDPPDVEPGEQQTLLVFARHGSLSRYLGEPPDFLGQDHPEWKAVLAEVVTEAVVRRIITLKYPAGQEEIDADKVYYDHFTFAGRLLPLMQRVVAVG